MTAMSWCHCVRCTDGYRTLSDPAFYDRHFRYACEVCGNKRCPHHADHRNACTNSNEPGQVGLFSQPKETTMSDIHPSPTEFSPEQLSADPILRFFHYKHLPEALRATSKPFCELAETVVKNLPRNAERTAALRKLLEAKDCAVRASLG